MTDVPDPWEGERVERWIRRSEALARQLAPVSDPLFEAAALVPGERVVDVGCGTGPVTRPAALAVGPGGHVLGLDVSDAMVEAARAIPVDDEAAPIDWEVADAVEWDPGPDRVDVVLSRFGVMFFSDPTAAFANLARATTPGGRLAVAVWRRRDDSGLFGVPLHAALDHLRTSGVTETAAGRSLEDFEATDDEGPFSLHDPDALDTLLTEAGWSDVNVSTRTLELPFAGGAGPAEAADAAVDSGPTRALLEGQDADTVRSAVDAIATTLADHVDGDGHVRLSGAVNIVTAARSPQEESRT